MEAEVTEVTPETQGQEGQEEPKYLTIEDKKALAEEYVKFKENGGRGVAEFAQTKGMSKWNLGRYIRQGKKQLKREGKKTEISWEERYAKVKEVQDLQNSGLTRTEAMFKVGITLSQFQYWLAIKGNRGWARRLQNGTQGPKKLGRPKNDAERVVKPFVIKDEDYNKSLRSRILALERVVIELTLDKQALLESAEGRI